MVDEATTRVLIREIKGRFAAKGLNITEDWLSDCVTWASTNFQGNERTQEKIEEFAYEQWQLTNIREISPGCLPANLKTQTFVLLNGQYCLQLDFFYDIANSFYTQLNLLRNGEIAAMGDADEEEEENPELKEWGSGPSQKKPGALQPRTLKFHFSDGVQDIEGIEYRPLPVFKGMILPGSKVHIKGPIECRRGVLMLEPKHLTLLGGEVEDLIVSNAPENYLARKLQLPENPDPYKNLTATVPEPHQPNTRTQGFVAPSNKSAPARSVQQQPSQQQPRQQPAQQARQQTAQQPRQQAYQQPCQQQHQQPAQQTRQQPAQQANNDDWSDDVDFSEEEMLELNRITSQLEMQQPAAQRPVNQQTNTRINYNPTSVLQGASSYGTRNIGSSSVTSRQASTTKSSTTTVAQSVPTDEELAALAEQVEAEYFTQAPSKPLYKPSISRPVAAKKNYSSAQTNNEFTISDEEFEAMAAAEAAAYSTDSHSNYGSNVSRQFNRNQPNKQPHTTQSNQPPSFDEMVEMAEDAEDEYFHSNSPQTSNKNMSRRDTNRGMFADEDMFDIGEYSSPPSAKFTNQTASTGGWLKNQLTKQAPANKPATITSRAQQQPQTNRFLSSASTSDPNDDDIWTQPQETSEWQKSESEKRCKLSLSKTSHTIVTPSQSNSSTVDASVESSLTNKQCDIRSFLKNPTTTSTDQVKKPNLKAFLEKHGAVTKTKQEVTGRSTMNKNPEDISEQRLSLHQLQDPANRPEEAVVKIGSLKTQQKMKNVDGVWQLILRLNDDSGFLDTELSNEIIEDIMGFSAGEAEVLSLQAIENPVTKERIAQAFARLKQWLKALNDRKGSVQIDFVVGNMPRLVKVMD